MRPDSSVSVFQAMMALLKANPESFYKNNINSLKAGYILRIDDVARFTAINKNRQAKSTQFKVSNGKRLSKAKHKFLEKILINYRVNLIAQLLLKHRQQENQYSQPGLN